MIGRSNNEDGRNEGLHTALNVSTFASSLSHMVSSEINSRKLKQIRTDIHDLKLLKVVI